MRRPVGGVKGRERLMTMDPLRFLIWPTLRNRAGSAPVYLSRGNEDMNMRRRTLRFGRGFNVIFGNRRSQAAQMVIEPGKSEGDSNNRHAGADQWLFVVDGAGVATVNGRRYPLSAGTLLLIEHGDRHEIRNTARGPLKTLNFYVPPAYTEAGEELPAAKPGG